MVFNIGSQSGGVFNNVAGDQWVTGQQVAVIGRDLALRAAIDLRNQLAGTPAGQVDDGRVRARAEEVASEIQSPNPDRSRIARLLERLTNTLLRSGQLVTAGAALVGPLRTLGQWLGALGAPLLKLLPLLA